MYEHHERIPPTLRQKIEDHLGELHFSQARINELGSFAVVQDKVFHNFSALRINKEDEGYSIAVKPGFKTIEEAKQYVKEAYKQDIVQHQNLLPEMNQDNELAIYKDGDGFCVGRELESGNYAIYSPTYNKLHEAERALAVAVQFEKDIEHINNGNLRVILNSFKEENWADDPDKEMKEELMKEKYTQRIENKKELNRSMQGQDILML